jgi:iron-sulfur cluster assembly accessory protein
MTMITITETAAKKALVLLERAKNEEGYEEGKTYGLRMQVVGGGCSGFQYQLGFDEPRRNDRTFEHNGLKVFVDARSILYLAGSTLDYKDGLMESGFKITNPNAKSSCGCGESFSV